jgi:uncharacterized protein (DUF1810 family)
MIALHSAYDCRVPVHSLTLLTAEMQDEVRNIIPDIVRCLQDFDGDVRQVAITCLSGLAKHGACDSRFPAHSLISLAAAMQDETRDAIPEILNCLHDTEWYVRQAAIEGLPAVAAHGMYNGRFRMRAASVFLFSYMLAAAMQEETRNVTPELVDRLYDEDWHVRQAALIGLSALVVHGTLDNRFLVHSLTLFAVAMQDEILNAIPAIVACLKDDDGDAHQAALESLPAGEAIPMYRAFEGHFAVYFLTYACSFNGR